MLDAGSGPATTIVVVGREAHSPTPETLRRLVAHTPPPRRIVVVDGGSPRTIARRVRALATDHDLTLIRSDAILGANEARNLARPHVRTEFVALLDNDTIVGPGWLAPLEQRARTTGAAVVVPAVGYGPSGFDRVHYAGGRCRMVDDGTGRRVEQRNVHTEAPMSTIDALEAAPTELLELHCALVRTDLLAQIGPLDEALIASRDEVDLSLHVAMLGREAWLEPAVVVGYPFPKQLRPADRSYFRARWSRQWGDRSFRALQRAWGLAEVGMEPRFRAGRDGRRLADAPGRTPTGPRAARVRRAVRRRADRVLTPLAVRRVDARRRRIGPARVVHRASWDLGA